MYRITPTRYRKAIEEWLKFSGSKKSGKKFFYNTLTFSLVLGLVVGLIFRELLLFPVVFVAMFLLFHGMLVLSVDRRTKFVESILPDALQLMAANSRAGYIPSRALLLSARKEFGPLADAIRNVGKDVLTGETLEESMKKIPQYIKSRLLLRASELIIEGTKAGGQFASLLEETADDIRRVQAIKKEVRANIMMYTIFIGFAGCIGAPALYALSGYLIETIGSFGNLVQIPAGVTASKTPFMGFSGISITPDFLFNFSLVALLITTVFGGVLIGMIGSGNKRAGIKYMPVLVVLALVIFFATKYLISAMFNIAIPV